VLERLHPLHEPLAQEATEAEVILRLNSSVVGARDALLERFLETTPIVVPFEHVETLV
jgi:hypothetical protein